MHSTPQLMDTDQTRQFLEGVIARSERMVCLSAFFSMPAFEWVARNSNGIDVELVLRGRPADFVQGSSSIAAVRSAIQAGWKVYFHSALHAKVYAFSETLVVGSGNLTANGLNLSSSRGNVELNIATTRTPEINRLIDGILASAIPIGIDQITRLEEFLSDHDSNYREATEWPEGVVEIVRDVLFCSDLPMAKVFSEPTTLDEPWRSIASSVQCNDLLSARVMLQGSIVSRWLEKTLKRHDREMSFGALSRALHDGLADDVTPYRRDVKALLANLLSFLSEIEGTAFEVVRPRHSQIVRLRET